ncbi:hypothetical protein EVAR_50268_1 [Eumeta japonica]|uniref:Uncharacterized protein n=1 Tax=Eumeta variegata TaxID=151549 RepID=A0A4C1Y7B8_EUMVA|nr:hypothetical protein EVAR_50268_1 [Eumeta japonica]
MVKPSKCTFGCELVTVLDYEFSEEEVQIFKMKLSAVLELESPSNAKSLHASGETLGASWMQGEKDANEMLTRRET